MRACAARALDRYTSLRATGDDSAAGASDTAEDEKLLAIVARMFDRYLSPAPVTIYNSSLGCVMEVLPGHSFYQPLSSSQHMAMSVSRPSQFCPDCW